MSRNHLPSGIQTLCNLLANLGICISREKPVLIPTQWITFIGAFLDALVSRAFLPADPFAILTSLIATLCRKPHTCIHQCLSLLGHMAACISITPHACLHICCLQLWLRLIYKPQTDCLNKSVLLHWFVLNSFMWWTDLSKVLVGTLFTPPTLCTTLTREASLTGWGVHLSSHMTHGLWIPREAKMHVNILELRVARLTCQAFLPLIRSYHIQLLSHNMATVVYINKQGSDKSLSLCAEASNSEKGASGTK